MSNFLTEWKLEEVLESDNELLFKWQNERQARRFMRNKSSPNLKEHEKWFNKRLMQFPLLFWKIICWTESKFNEPVGFIRLDELGRSNTYEVSILISNQFNGQGLATNALKKICKKFSHLAIYACISKDNIASIKVFKKSGFTECESVPSGNTTEWSWHEFVKK